MKYHRIKYFLTILAINFIVSCKTNNISIKKYESKNIKWYDLVYGVLNGCNRIISGSELELKKDSSFTRSTCGDKIKGKYTIEEECLVLKIDSIYLQEKNVYVINNDSNRLSDKYQIRFGSLISYSQLKIKMGSEYKFVKAVEVLR